VLNLRIADNSTGDVNLSLRGRLANRNIQNHAPMAKVLASNRARRKCLCKLQSFPL
jgi:hypothetical protein